jgi:hypothetical protein
MQRKLSLVLLMGLLSFSMGASGEDPGTRAVTGGPMGAGLVPARPR